MRTKLLILTVLLLSATFPAAAQKPLTIWDPTVELMDEVPALPDAEAELNNKTVLPKLKAKYNSDGCTVDPELLGEVSGVFTKKGVVQKVALYQVCVTGNGLGIVALVMFEDDKLVGIWGEESGWAMRLHAISDMNTNGFDELTLAFGGGLHQGQGGVGVEIVEFQNGKLQVLGWFQAEQSMDGEAETAWKVTAKPGKIPVFYRQKYKANSRGKLLKTGTNTIFKLTKVENKFEQIK